MLHLLAHVHATCCLSPSRRGLEVNQTMDRFLKLAEAADY